MGVLRARSSSPDNGASEATHGSLWLSYLSGGFGLGLSAQVGFLIPLRAHELGASIGFIGLIIGLNSFAPAILSVPMGAMIDRIGAERSFVLGAAGATLMTALFVAVPSYQWFAVLLPFSGLARSVGWLASQAHITSLGEPGVRAAHAGRFSSVANISQMVGPLVAGGATQLFGLRTALLVPAVFSLIFTVNGLFLLAAKRATPDPKTPMQGMGIRSSIQLMSIRGVQVGLLLTSGRLWLNTVYVTFVPLFLIGEGFAPGVVGTIIASSGLVAALIAPTVGFFVAKFSEQRVCVSGLALSAAALVLTPVLTFSPAVYIVPILAGIGFGLSLPLLLSIVTGSAGANNRAVALGSRNLASQTAAAAAPVVVGPLVTVLGMGLGIVAGGVIGAAIVGGAGLLSRADR